MVPKSILVCGLAGLAGQVLSTPFHVASLRLQHDAAKGLPHHHSLTKTISNLYRKEGVSCITCNLVALFVYVPRSCVSCSFVTDFFDILSAEKS